MSIPWLADRLRADGSLSVHERGPWQGRTAGGTFSPVGVLIHHTASPIKSSNANPVPSLNTVINGRSDLSGPLCHVLVGYDGVCNIIAGGYAHHAGVANPSGPVPGGDGNTLYVGIEVDYSPQLGQSPQQVQILAAAYAAAAIVTMLGNGRNWVRYHRETSTEGKIDPSGFPSGNDFRIGVGERIAARWR